MTPTLFDTVGDASSLDYGTLSIRVVVLPKVEKGSTPEPDDEEAAMEDPDELLPEEGKTPVSTYLESTKRGRLCCVFLVNGQRQEALDNTFIVQDLDFKYLRTRMMVIVDMEGLRNEALSEL